MPEPEQYAKDADGFTWHKSQCGDWQLVNHENMLCYIGFSWPKLQIEYGPMRLLTRFELLHIG